jgi:hypothetical protein
MGFAHLARLTFTHFIDRYFADRPRLGLAAVESPQEKRE